MGSSRGRGVLSSLLPGHALAVVLAAKSPACLFVFWAWFLSLPRDSLRCPTSFQWIPFLLKSARVGFCGLTDSFPKPVYLWPGLLCWASDSCFHLKRTPARRRPPGTPKHNPRWSSASSLVSPVVHGAVCPSWWATANPPSREPCWHPDFSTFLNSTRGRHWGPSWHLTRWYHTKPSPPSSLTSRTLHSKDVTSAR